MLIHGRLSPGVSVAQASAAVSAVTSPLAKQYPATNELKAGIVAPYDPMRQSRSLSVPVTSGRRADPDRNGAAGRVPEYLRHDAGSQRDARAGTVHPPGDRRQPGTADPVSLGRSDHPGGSGRDSRFACALQRSVGAVLAGRTTPSGSAPGGAESGSVRWSRSVSGSAS